MKNTVFLRKIYAGLVTFLADSYILAVNPAILSSAGMDRGGVLCATAIAAFIGTLCMAFFANFPLLLAPGMGVIAWTLLNCGIKGRVNWLLWCISLLFIAKYIYL